MFARNVVLRLKPSSLNEFKRVIDTKIIPFLLKQSGFKDLFTFAMTGGTDVTAISLWETREQAEVYQTAAYPQVMKHLEALLDGSPKLRVADIVNSTLHKRAVSVAA
jgi:hypothetical protein